MKVQDSIKKETLFVAASTAFGACLMIIAFFFLHRAYPDYVPFDYRVPLSAAVGTFVATANFFLMGMTIQNIVENGEQDHAYQKVRTSFRYRTLMQLAWIGICMIAPCFQIVAGLVPLFLPALFIKIRGIFFHG